MRQNPNRGKLASAYKLDNMAVQSLGISWSVEKENQCHRVERFTEANKRRSGDSIDRCGQNHKGRIELEQ